MQKVTREFVTLTFTGPRFEDHGLDIDVLSELIAYKEILVETAKQLWRRDNPIRERVPRGFEESIVLKFRELRAGSTSVPLLREIEHDEDELPIQAEDAVDQAARVIDEGIDAAQKQNLLPRDFPRETLPLFEKFGKTLLPGHSIRIQSAGRNVPVCYDTEVRRRLMNWTERTFEDRVDLIGEVRIADLDGCNFRIRLEDGKKVDGRFAPEHESLITEALREHSTRRVRVRGTAQYLQPGKELDRIILVEDIAVLPAHDQPFCRDVQPVWKTILEIAERIPEDELRNLPSDASVNLDHYLYGAPKKPS